MLKHSSDYLIYKRIPNNVLAGKKKIIVGCSGGSDSTLLVNILHQKIKNAKENIIVCHINFKLRGIDSDNDELMVIESCKKLNLRLLKFEFDLSSHKSGIQEKARNYRIQKFFDLSRKLDTSYIFLGHNQDDHIETILLNITRGTNLNGLKGIRSKKIIQRNKKRITLFRPLIDIQKKEIEKLCKEKKIKFRLDRSNKSNFYSRNLIRNKIIPELEKINPNIRKSINNLSKIIDKESSNKILSNNEFQGMNLAEAKAIILDRLNNLENSEKGYFFSYDHHQMIEDVLLGNSKSENLPGDIILNEKDGYFILENLKNKRKLEDFRLKIKIPGKARINDQITLVSKIINTPSNLIINNQNKIFISEKFINKNLYIRSKRDGDRLHQSKDMAFSSRVKKIISNNKKKKENVLLLCTEKQILWIIGVRQSIDSYVQKKDKKVLEFSLLKNSI